MTAHIPDKGEVMVRYYGLYANAHRGKVRKAGRPKFPMRIVEEEPRRLPAKGWAEMIRWGHVQILWNLVRVPLFQPSDLP